MKLSIGTNIQPGPWGGGNQFVRALVEYLSEKDWTVCFDLKDPDLDTILLTDPRSNLKSSAYSDREIRKYLARTNRRTIVVHRINECDERKGTTDVNRILLRANRSADHTVFVSSWLRDLFLARGMRCKSYGVILNGSDRRIFNAEGYRRWDHASPLRLVTHHWGGHWMKGFYVYEQLDHMLATEEFGQEIAFTYIGNLPQGFRFRNAAYVEPKHGVELANLIRGHHVYVTASRNEPGSHHQNEGACCGLPLLYIESGSLPEYCRGFGIPFTTGNFQQKLQEMMTTYDHWAERVKDYPHTAERTCASYYSLFTELLERRDDLIRRRSRWRRLSEFFSVLM